MASDANNEEGSESSGDDDTGSSDASANLETSTPKRKRTKSAELAAQIPKVDGSSDSIFSSWDSVLGASKGDDNSLFAPPPVLAGAKPTVSKPTIPDFLLGDDELSAPSPNAPRVTPESDETESESDESKSDETETDETKSDETESDESKSDETESDETESESESDKTESESESDETEPKSESDSEAPPSATTEPRNSTKSVYVAGEFRAPDPVRRATVEAAAEKRWKAAFEADEPEVGKPGSPFDAQEAENNGEPLTPEEDAPQNQKALESSDDTKQAEEASADEPDSPRPARTVVRASESEQSGNSRGLLFVLVAAAAIVLVFVFVSSARNANDHSEQPLRSSKPNAKSDDKAGTKAKAEEPRPEPRSPTNAKTHNADKAEPARDADETGTETGGETGTETGGESETGTGDEAETGTGDEAETGDETETGEAAAPEAPAPTPASQSGANQRRDAEDPRAASLIPPGTSAEAAKAFTRMPVSMSDGAPLAGIGISGIHVDELQVGGSDERENTGCDAPSGNFSASSTGFINVCIRVVHNRNEETLRIIWEKDGAVTRRGKVKIPEKLHAYKTRAYLQVRPEYVGSWRVRIVPEGEEDTDLAVAEFQISG